MNFELVSITLRNIRRVREGTIKPLPTGMTAINGPVGAGKSSFITAMLWSFYGVTPLDVPVKGMRRQGSDGEPCFVTVQFRHAGQLIEVTRGLEGRKDATNALLLVDGSTVAKSSKMVTAWITERFGGMDAKGFTTAFVVQQKELDDLVRARPEARRALIERLAGIDRMSDALKAARDEAVDAGKVLDLLPGSAEELDLAEKALEASQVASAGLHEDAATAQDAAAAADETARTSVAAAADMHARAETARAAVVEATRLGAVADRLGDEADRFAADTSRLLAAAAGGDPETLLIAYETVDEITDRLARLTRLATDVAREKEMVARERSRATGLRKRADDADRLARDTAGAAFTATTAADTAVRDAAACGDETDARRQSQEAAEVVGGTRGETRRLQASLAALDATDQPVCPTCETDLSDPSALRARLQTELDEATRHGTEAARAQQGWAARADGAQNAARKADRNAIEAVAATTAAEHAERNAVLLGREAAEAQESADESQSGYERVEHQAAEAAAETPRLRDRKTQADEKLRAAERAADALAALPETRVAADLARAAADTAWAAAAAADEFARTRQTEPGEVETAAARAAADTEKARSAATSAVAADGDARVAAEKADRAEQDRDRALNRLRARSDAFARHEEKTAVAQGLAAFRKDRVARLGPEMSEIATDLMAALSDGEYVAVEFDENFTPYVTDAAGEVRPASYLSGGEESEVAIAQRLALREIVAGQGGGLIIFDEPFTSQDKDKRTSVMSALRALPDTQIVIINHASEATDMVDLVFHVTKDIHGGSTVTSGAAVDGDEIDADEHNPVGPDASLDADEDAGVAGPD